MNEQSPHTTSSKDLPLPGRTPSDSTGSQEARDFTYPISFSRDELDTILAEPEHDPAAVISLLERDFADTLDKSVGVWEGYTLREHTSMVLGQVGKYVRQEDLPQGVSKSMLELACGLHDMGKPRALREGDKNLHHAYGREVIEDAFTQLGYTEQETRIAAALVDGDPIGALLTYRATPKRAAAEVYKRAQDANMPVGDFWKLQKLFYMVDAGSYTQDAGGQQSLDHLFDFDPAHGTVSFSSDTENKVRKLETALTELTGEQLQEPAQLGHYLGAGAVAETVKRNSENHKQTWNIERTPQISEAIQKYQTQEDNKINEAQQRAMLIGWAQRFIEGGAQLPPESTRPDVQIERQDIVAKLQALGCSKLENLADEIPYAIDRQIVALYDQASKIYADAVLPLALVTETQMKVTDQLSAAVNTILAHAQDVNAKTGRKYTAGVDQLNPLDLRSIADEAQAQLQEQLDSERTPYAHTTNFLDKVIQSGFLSPRAEDGVANTGNHSTGVHFSRDQYEVPRFGFDGPGLQEYLRKEGKSEADLLRGDIIFPLGALVEEAPIRAESNTTMYSVEDIWGKKRVRPVNVKDPDQLEYLKPESLKKQVGSLTGTNRKQAGDSVFFAAESAAEAYDYKFPIDKAYLIVQDEADGERARALLGMAGHTEEWIADHLIVGTSTETLQEVRRRMNRQTAHIVAPLAAKRPPAEYRDYTQGQQYSGETELVVLSATHTEDLIGAA